MNSGLSYVLHKSSIFEVDSNMTFFYAMQSRYHTSNSKEKAAEDGDNRCDQSWNRNVGNWTLLWDVFSVIFN